MTLCLEWVIAVTSDRGVLVSLISEMSHQSKTSNKCVIADSRM